MCLTAYLIWRTSRRTSSLSSGNSLRADRTRMASCSRACRSSQRGDSGMKVIRPKAGRRNNIDNAMTVRQDAELGCAKAKA